jgi:hypothetical protein
MFVQSALLGSKQALAQCRGTDCCTSGPSKNTSSWLHQAIHSSCSHCLIQLAYMIQGSRCPGHWAAVLRGHMAKQAGVAEHIARHSQGGRVHTMLPADGSSKTTA